MKSKPLSNDEQTNRCPVCRQPKPVNMYCSNDCRYLVDANLEDAIPAVLGRWHSNNMKATEAHYSTLYLFERELANQTAAVGNKAASQDKPSEIAL